MLSGVPKDVFSLIIKYLPIASVLNLDRTCRRFHNVLIDLRYFDILRRQIVIAIPNNFCEKHKKQCENVHRCTFCFKRSCDSCCKEKCLFCKTLKFFNDLKECQICDIQTCTSCNVICKFCKFTLCSYCEINGFCQECIHLCCNKCITIPNHNMVTCKICKIDQCIDCFVKFDIACELSHPKVCKDCLVKRNKYFI